MSLLIKHFGRLCNSIEKGKYRDKEWWHGAILISWPLIIRSCKTSPDWDKVLTDTHPFLALILDSYSITVLQAVTPQQFFYVNSAPEIPWTINNSNSFANALIPQTHTQVFQQAIRWKYFKKLISTVFPPWTTQRGFSRMRQRLAESFWHTQNECAYVCFVSTYF